MRLVAIAVILGLATAVAAGPEAAKAPSAAGKVYGKPLADAPVMKISDVLAKAAELEGKPVRVEGVVAGVCAKRGCWIEIAEENGPASITFKVVDGVMVFPMSAKGKWAVVDGTVSRMPLTLEETRARLAEEAEESGAEFDPSTVTEPTVYVRIDGIGARIRDRK